MVASQLSFTSRRVLLAGLAASSALALPACSSLGTLSLVDAIRRLLTRSSRNALARLVAPGGFYDNELARLDLPEVFGSRGGVLQNILTRRYSRGACSAALTGLPNRARAAPRR